MNGMFQGEGSLASSQQGSSGIMSQPKKEESSFQGEGGVDNTPQKPPSKPSFSFNFQGEGGEDNNSDTTYSGTVVTNNEVDDVIAEYKLPPVLTSYNNTVKNLQTYLNNTPIAPELSTDGRWGAKTSAAVSDFQRYKDELYKRSTTAAERFNETGDIASRTTTKPAFERFQVADSGAGFGALSDAASLDGYKPILRPQKLMDNIKEPFWKKSISKVNNPIFSDNYNVSALVVDTANKAILSTLEGPFKLLQEKFGKTLIINDALAKKGTTRKDENPTSRHFHGDALDISTKGMNNGEKLKLVEMAREAGFTGFGFGPTILHIDTSKRRTWSYGNKYYAGKPVIEMIIEYKKPAKK